MQNAWPGGQLLSAECAFQRSLIPPMAGRSFDNPWRHARKWASHFLSVTLPLPQADPRLRLSTVRSTRSEQRFPNSPCYSTKTFLFAPGHYHFERASSHFEYQGGVRS